jgi:ubiquinone/menaquinone biosynthesis C-methylase UbiE
MINEPSYLRIFITKLLFIFYRKSVYKEFANHLPIEGNEQVLDFGCGMGSVAYYVAKKLPYGHLTCLDISKRWLKVCRKTMNKSKNVTFINSSINLSSNCFDIIYCHFALHKVANLEMIILLLIRTLKKDGLLILKEPIKDIDKLNNINMLVKKYNLTLKKIRITDSPLIVSSIESIYIK